jgi:hypothetical protein
MVKLGIGNSRMKDFWDVQFLIKEFSFDGKLLQRAIRATFARRQTAVPRAVPIALTETFTGDSEVIADWKAFIKRGKITSDTELNSVIENLRIFFAPLVKAEAENAAFRKIGRRGPGWTI